MKIGFILITLFLVINSTVLTGTQILNSHLMTALYHLFLDKSLKHNNLFIYVRAPECCWLDSPSTKRGEE